MTKTCPCTGKPIGKGTVALAVAGTAALAGATAAAWEANRIIDKALVRRAVTDDRAFFESLAASMPGTDGLEFAEARRRARQKVEELQGELYTAAQVERVEIPSATPSQKVVAYIYRPEQPSTRWALLAHGYRGDHYEMDGIATYYLRRGFNVLSCDLCAQGESDGRYIGLGAVEAADLLLWIDYIRVRFGEACSIVLHGQSQGASCALIAAGAGVPAQVKAVVSDGAYTQALALVRTMAFRIKQPGDAVSVALRVVMRLRSGIDLARADALAAVRTADTPMLFLHGGADQWIPSPMAVELYTAAAAPVRELHVVRGAGHSESFALDPDAYFALVDAFLEKAGL